MSQSQHQPRIQMRSEAESELHRRNVTAAPLLDLPEVTETKRGRLLTVVSVGLLDEPHVPYIQCADASIYRLPEPLRAWANSFISVHLHNIQHGIAPLLPSTIEYGVMDGMAVAHLQDDIPEPHQSSTENTYDRTHDDVPTD